VASSEPQPPGLYGAVYVSPHEDEVLVSCPARMLSERAHRLKILVVVAFARGARREPTAATRAFERLGIAVQRLERREQDSALGGLQERLADLALQTKARHVYLPLGADARAGSRLCHEAGLRALHEVSGRNVYFYEERPQALLPGAIRIRLGELGARLPPAATDIKDDASLLRACWGFFRAPFLHTEQPSLLERVRATQRMASSHRAARAWNPLRALGLRLQPVLEATEAADFEGLLGVLAALEPRLSELFGSPERLRRDAAAYARRIAGRPYAERYWLLLPPRDENGLAAVPLATGGPLA
jgi:hypothetical protein